MIHLNKILVIDNYDSFVYNLAQLLGELGTLPNVIRNDKITITEIRKMCPDGIVISPGPGHPADKKSFGVCGEVITALGPDIPILGVCLGHQGIAQVYGGKVINAKRVVHGKTELYRVFWRFSVRRTPKSFRSNKIPFPCGRSKEYSSLP